MLCLKCLHDNSSYKEVLDPNNSNIVLLTTTANDNDYNYNRCRTHLLHLSLQRQGGKLESLKGTSPQCVAFNPGNSNHAFCCTFGDGLWQTDDGGQTWNRIGKVSISSKEVMSVAVSRHHLKRENNEFNTVYVAYVTGLKT